MFELNSDIHTRVVHHTEEDKYTVAYSQDAGRVLKQTEQLRHQREALGDAKTYKVAAQIPVVTLYLWGQEDFQNPLAYFGKVSGERWLKLARRLNDPEFQKLRIWEGRLGKEDSI